METFSHSEHQLIQHENNKNSPPGVKRISFFSPTSWQYTSDSKELRKICELIAHQIYVKMNEIGDNNVLIEHFILTTHVDGYISEFRIDILIKFVNEKPE